jgi:pimeloyl-ACP methyl ester carboxylesterase
MSPFPSSSIEGSRGPFGSLDWGGPRGSLVVLVVLVIMLALAAPAGAWQGELANSAGAASRSLPAVSRGPVVSSPSVVSCEAAPGGVCGRVVVPLNRQDPGGAKIGIAYVLFRHSDLARPALGTIFVTEGGPGYSAINNMQQPYLSMFGPLLARRDLVLIDQRGVGRSRAIDCPALQKGIGDPYSLVAGCGAQLGASSDLYGSAEVAADIDAVRAALGVGRFDFYGGSYAGMDIQAYAARFPGRLRSVVLDSAVVLPVEDPWNSLAPAQIVKTVELVCARSVLCSSGNPDPAGEVSWLARRLRAQPVDGVGRDANGVPHTVSVTEARLVNMLQNDAGAYLVQGEIPAAARALRGGDPVPLLRLAAENDATTSSSGTGSDPMLNSAGDNFARFCTDAKFQWDKAASPAQRRAQFDQARATLDPNRFAPFSLDGWVVPSPLGFLPDLCIGWPAPIHHPQPPVPAGAVVPGLPALVLTGNLDLSVPPAESAQLTRMFPRASVVSVAESGHHTAFNFQFRCAQALVDHFIDTVTAGDTSCARHPSFIAPAVSSFPRRATPQEDLQGEEASEEEALEGGSLRERVARIAAATVTDAFRRAFIQNPPGDGVGLRGGTFHAEFGSTAATLRLAAARLAEDVLVTGDVTYTEFTTLDAKLSVTGAAHGTLQVHGIWAETGATRLTITGQLDGHPINTSVPAT